MHEVAPLVAPVSASLALRRIAYLLERSGAGRYRVEAFRRAGRAIDALGPNATTELVRTGRLRDIDGIGSTTATVVEQAVAGEMPDYLQRLQAVDRPLADGRRQLYGALRGDLHMHSDFSDGGAPVDEMVATAAELGQSWTAVTDHSPRLTVANGLSAERLSHQIDLIDAINAALPTFRVLRGIEVDILDDGSLDQTEEMLSRLDVVTASVHSKLSMDAAAMTRRMVAAVRNRNVNVLGHCTGRLVAGGRGRRAASRFDAGAVFAACADSGTAVEINSRPERQDPPDDLIGIAMEAGCLFAIDSDAHAPGQLDFKSYGCERAERLGIPADRVVTTWDVDAVVEWVSATRG